MLSARLLHKALEELVRCYSSTKVDSIELNSFRFGPLEYVAKL